MDVGEPTAVVEAAGSVQGADADQPPPPPAAVGDEPPAPPCGRPLTDDDVTTTDNFIGSSCAATVARTDSALTDAEARWLALYPTFDRQQLAELREAFLVFAVDADAPAEMTPRTAAAVADSAQLGVGDVGTCLRAVGQNPTQADVDRITAILPQPPPPPQQQAEDSTGPGGLAPASTSSNRNLLPSASTKQPSTVLGALPRGVAIAAVTSDIAATSRLSVDQTSTPDVRHQSPLCFIRPSCSQRLAYTMGDLTF